MIGKRLLRRRGANAIEFALVLPFLLWVLAGTLDYGYYFLQQWFVMNAIREAVRWGSMQAPADGEAEGSCAACVTATSTRATTLLSDYGITVDSAVVTPTIQQVDGTSALSLEPAIAHTPLVGLVPLPSNYSVDAIWFLQNVSGC